MFTFFFLELEPSHMYCPTCKVYTFDFREESEKNGGQKSIPQMGLFGQHKIYTNIWWYLSYLFIYWIISPISFQQAVRGLQNCQEWKVADVVSVDSNIRLIWSDTPLGLIVITCSRCAIEMKKHYWWHHNLHYLHHHYDYSHGRHYI